MSSFLTDKSLEQEARFGGWALPKRRAFAEPGTEPSYPPDRPCTTPAGTLEFNLQVDGKRFDYDTAYEFAGVVYDAAELRSAVVIASGVTPGAPI